MKQFLIFFVVNLFFISKTKAYKLKDTFNHGEKVYKLKEVKLDTLDYLVSGSDQGTLKIWDINQNILKYTFDRSNGVIQVE